MDAQSVWMQIQCIMTCCKLLISAAICTALVGGVGVVSGYTGEELAKNAKITLSDARVIALRYSFDIKSAGVTHEVGVDAKTGKLLENSAEGPHAD
jgi:hypothetical protein